MGTPAPGEEVRRVTLGAFPGPARAFARARPNLRPADGNDLVDLVLAHDETFDSRYTGRLPLRRVYLPDPDPGDHD
jgi:hypothetical protein